MSSELAVPAFLDPSKVTIEAEIFLFGSWGTYHMTWTPERIAQVMEGRCPACVVKGRQGQMHADAEGWWTADCGFRFKVIGLSDDSNTKEG